MFASQYANRRVFITGHTGFKGAWLASWLLGLGAEVCGYALAPPTSPAMFTALGLEKRLRHITGEVQDLPALQQAIKDFDPHCIFHLAAQALVRPSYEAPADTFATNAMGTVNLLEAVRRCANTGSRSLASLILVTSDKCYRNDEWEWGYRETDHLGGEDPYSASKACAEIIAHSYFSSFFSTLSLGCATVRAGNVIGGGDWALDRIVPDCARAYLEGRAVTLRNPQATRPWQHVLEPLSGYLWLGALFLSGQRDGLQAEAFNFGPPTDTKATVGEVATALGQHWPGFSAFSEADCTKNARESTLLKLCCDKALARLDWQATLSFAETMRLTADWYRACPPSGQTERANGEAAACTEGQIAEYSQLAQQRGLLWAR